MNHTPAPWIYLNLGEKENCWVVGALYDENGRQLSQEEGQRRWEDGDESIYPEAICEMEEGAENLIANMRLIASAPDIIAENQRLTERVRELEDWVKAMNPRKDDVTSNTLSQSKEEE